MFGGVYSSLGKGVCVSSLAKILSSFNYNVSVLKMDPYLNVDPETMAPGQHGEVYVTEDGAQTDLDLGNYERFLNKTMTRYSNLTSGRIYWDILTKERVGGYKGKTVQVIPHVTDYIKRHIMKIINAENPDFLLIEVGGTIGDMESIPFVESLSQLTTELGIHQVLSCLVSPLIMLDSTSGEMKTKPTQHALKELHGSGIFPNILILRTRVRPNQETVDKLSMICHLSPKGIFVAPDVKSIYDLPELFYEQKMHEFIFKYFHISMPKRENTRFLKWTDFIHQVNGLRKTVNIALVGKYVSLHDSYASLIEALRFASWQNSVKLNLIWVDAERVDKNHYPEHFKNIDGAIVPGGFGLRGTEEMIDILQYLRTNNIPTLGVCLGMQLMVIEYARNVLNLGDATSAEFDKNTETPIIDMIDGHLRLGNQEIRIIPDTIASKLYTYQYILERHRHRYALINQQYIKWLGKNGMVVSGIARNRTLKLPIAEIVEVPSNKFYMGCQYHPEFSSYPNEADPIFVNFIKASIKPEK